ncbi:hypothetical protein MNBD_GAMMA04-768 [hydrothermal vent metagenome]|uniref:Uncharacterized protein n=1 Tax=hydrothermal vent metagenome TaxID=652676 RepID=A0A3B0VYA6_9ZZZZ
MVEQLSPSIPVTLESKEEHKEEHKIKGQQAEKITENNVQPSTKQALALRFTKP